MKSSNIIKLLAALLCVVVMFVSCADSAAIPETNGVDSLSGTAGTVTSLSGATGTSDVGVEGTEPLTFSDFIEFIDRDKVYTTVEDAPKGAIDIYENFCLIYESSVDSKNQLTYSYEVVNIETGESYKKWKHTADLACPDREISVKFVTPDDQNPAEAAVIMVLDTKCAEISDEMRDGSYYFGNEDRYYVESKTCSVYDFYGNAVFENKPISTQSKGIQFYALPTNNAYAINVSDGYYYLLDKDGKYDKEIDVISLENFAYDYENETYGYYLRAMHYYYYDDAIQVYEKASGKLVYHKVYSGMDMDSSFGPGTIVNVLEDGKILVQEIRNAYKGEAYDFYMEGETYMLDSYTIQFTNENDEFKAIETPVELNYFFMEVSNAGNLEDGEIISDVVISDKVVNFARHALKIEDRAASMNFKTVFFDNNLNVQCELDSISSDMFATKLDNGYSYISVGFNSSYNALYDPEGNFVRYLTSDNVLMNDFIVNSYGIFDYNFECLYEFDENVFIEAYIGDSIIIREYTEDDPDTSYDEENEAFYRLTLDESANPSAESKESLIKKTELRDVVKIDPSYSDFIILMNEDGTYELYNSDFELLFISMTRINLTFNEYFDAYVMNTIIKNEIRTYIIK